MDLRNKWRKISSCLDERKIDRISKLPEPIQRHIFSYLPMEDAVKARTLSKEWKHVRPCVPNIDFDQQHFDKKKKQNSFEDFAYQILHLHDESDIQRFSLCANTDYKDMPYIEKLISFAVDHNVQEIVISDFNMRRLQLPCSLFTCRTLTKLVLCKVHLSVPQFVEFPMLKVVTLDVTCNDENPLDILIPSCPVLEEFSLETFYWNVKSVVDINTATARYLNLKVSYPTSRVNISAASLQEIKCIGLPPNISPKTLSSLCRAHFEFPRLFDTNDLDMNALCFNAYMTFSGLHNVTSLSQNWLFFECLSKAQVSPETPLVICARLKHLKLELCSTDGHVYGFVCLLKSCPNLQTLSITFMEAYVQEYPSPRMPSIERLQLHRLAKGTILQHLKAVALVSFGGSESELILARCILGSAILLEEMKIRFLREIREDEAKQMYIRRQFMMFTKVSPSAKTGKIKDVGFEWTLAQHMGLLKAIERGASDPGIMVNLSFFYKPSSSPCKALYRRDVEEINVCDKREIQFSIREI